MPENIQQHVAPLPAPTVKKESTTKMKLKNLASIAELVATQQVKPQQLKQPVTTVSLASRAAKRFEKAGATFAFQESQLLQLVSLNALIVQREHTLIASLGQRRALNVQRENLQVPSAQPLVKIVDLGRTTLFLVLSRATGVSLVNTIMLVTIPATPVRLENFQILELRQFQDASHATQDSSAAIPPAPVSAPLAMPAFTLTTNRLLACRALPVKFPVLPHQRAPTATLGSLRLAKITLVAHFAMTIKF